MAVTILGLRWYFGFGKVPVSPFVVGVVTPVWLTERASDPPYHFDCGSHIGSGALRARVWGVAASSLVTRKARSHVWWGWITGCNYSWNFE